MDFPLLTSSPVCLGLGSPSELESLLRNRRGHRVPWVQADGELPTALANKVVNNVKN